MSPGHMPDRARLQRAVRIVLSASREDLDVKPDGALLHRIMRW